MSAWAWIALIVSSLIVIAFVAWVIANNNHPENASSHGDEQTPGDRSDEYYKGVGRPAGPDAEAMDPEAFGGDHRPPE